MTNVSIESHDPFFGSPYWTATWVNGKRTFVHGYYLTDTLKFDTLDDILEWANRNSSILDSSPGGGYGIGVTLYLYGWKIAEYWFDRNSNTKIEKTYIQKRD